MPSHPKSIYWCLLCYPGAHGRSTAKLSHYMGISKAVFQVSFGYYTSCSLQAICSSWIKRWAMRWQLWAKSTAGGGGDKKKYTPWIFNMAWCKLTVKLCNAAQSITLNNKHETNMVLSKHGEKRVHVRVQAHAHSQKQQVSYETMKSRFAKY